MRRRILLLVVGMTTLVVLAFAIPLALLIPSVVVRNEESDVVDRANRAASYLRGVQTLTDKTVQSVVDAQKKDDDHRTWITTPTGTVVGTPPAGAGASGGYPTGRIPRGDGDPSGDGDGPGGPGAQLRDGYGGRVATTIVTSPGSQGVYQVNVWISTGSLHDGEYGWWVLLVAGCVLLLGIGIAGGEVVTRRIVRPLERSAQTAHRISGGDVSARAPTTGPREVAEMGSALNQLADRIDELIVEERETVANLSHRMRTPLTALRLDAEALRDPGDAERIGGHVSALERTLTGVIRAARRPQREGRVPVADATAVVAERVAFWSALTEEQDRSVAVNAPTEPVFVRSSAEDLAAAVDALVENVDRLTGVRSSHCISAPPRRPHSKRLPRLDVVLTVR